MSLLPLALAGGAVLAAAMAAGAAPRTACVLETRYLRLTVLDDGTVGAFAARATGRDWLATPGRPLAAIRLGSREVAASRASFSGGLLRLAFGDTGVKATLRTTQHPRYLGLQVVGVRGTPDALRFVDIALGLEAKPGEPFAACVLARDLRTDVPEIPRPAARLRATCYRRFGIERAAVALIGCPPGELRAAMQDAVRESPELPQSPVGGPWALGKPINQGSYLFSFGGLTEQTSGEWIALARSLGMTQIDFHGGSSFRFGDCEPNPAMYPDGRASLKAVVDRLHAAGIAAGLHTYAFFIDKRCPWVTPVPDRRLAADAAFTLSSDLTAGATTVPVAEPTGAMSTVTGFFVRNSVTLHVDDELITYTGVSKTAPFAFTGCTRGALGTRPAAHRRGARVRHLKECFGLFVPDPATSLFAEVAARTAETFNACGFDMIYLDALDGEDILGGAEAGWHYGSRFVFEIWKRLRRPALMEASTFHHHLWFVRSRMGAWDHPNRAHKRFIDLHCEANEANRRMFLPGQLGWWALKTWSGPQSEPTFSDDIEYLMAKCLGTDTGFALMGIDPASAAAIPALTRLGALIRRYEDLRHSGVVPEAVKARLRRPGAEFMLEAGARGEPVFWPVQWTRRTFSGPDDLARAWRVNNPYAAQPLAFRLETLMGVDPASTVGAPAVDLSSERLSEPAAAPGVTLAVRPGADRAPDGAPAAELEARNGASAARGAWCQVTRTFESPLDLSTRQGIGVWVRGDGSGALLNIQVRSPEHLVGGIGDHYVVLDFSGWRYVELVEPEGESWDGHGWPYGNPYSIYRESVQYGQVASLSVWLNEVPAGGWARCALGPIRFVALAPLTLRRPVLDVNGVALALPFDVASGQYVEVLEGGACRLYGPKGELVREAALPSPLPEMRKGACLVTLRCEAGAGDPRPRARLGVVCRGAPFAAAGARSP